MGEFESAFPLFEDAIGFSPQDASLYLDYGAASLSADQLAKAKELAKKAADLSPRDSRARLLYGRVLFHLEDYPAAKTQLEAALAVNADFETGYLLGRTYLLLKDQKSAQSLFAEMVAGLGDTALIHTYFGRAYNANDYQDQAMAEFKKALTRDPRALGAHYYLGLCYLGHNEAAGYAQAVPEFRAELQNHPDDFSSHYMLGYIAFQQRRFSEAEEELNRAASLKPQDVGTLLYLAKVYQETGKVPESEATLRKAVETPDPTHANEAGLSRAHYMLGQMLMRMGKQDEGQKELRTFAEMDRQLRKSTGVNAETRTVGEGSLARKESQGEEEVAKRSSPEESAQLEAFQRRLSPPIAGAYNSLGAFVASHEDFKSAMEYFREASIWDPSLEGVDRNLGVVSFYAGQYNQAIESLKHYLQSHPSDAIAQSTLGLSYVQTASFRDAVQVFQSIESAVDGDPKLSYAYALALVKTGEYSRAIARLEELDEKNPNSAEIHAALYEARAGLAANSPGKQESHW